VKERLAAVLSSLKVVQLAVLFGSAARGSVREGSDVDVAVRLEPDTLEVRRQVEVALARAVGRDVDVISLDASPPQLRFEIARDGVLLSERTPRSWVDFRARAMVDWWDWAPTARRIHEAALKRLRKKVARGTP
jgi:predicted nucleotidyltransferase